MLKIRAIDHINMFVNDLEESIQFYKKIFGFEIIEESSFNKLGTPYVIMGIENCAYLALHKSLQSGDGQDNRAPIYIAHFGFHVENFDEIISLLKHFSVTVLHHGNVIEWPLSRSIYILDPNGHEIELVERFGGRERW